MANYNCPFCGYYSTTMVERAMPPRYTKLYDTQCYRFCDNCGARGPVAPDIYQATEAWDERDGNGALGEEWRAREAGK